MITIKYIKKTKKLNALKSAELPGVLRRMLFLKIRVHEWVDKIKQDSSGIVSKADYSGT